MRALEINVVEAVKQAAKGDAEAFTELARHFQNLAYGSAYSILGDFHLAHDVTQEAFVAAYFGLRRLEEPKAFPSWLRSIVRHQCHRILRKQRVSAVPLESAMEQHSESPRPDQELERKELRDEVLAAVEALPATQKEVVTLFYLKTFPSVTSLRSCLCPWRR